MIWSFMISAWLNKQLHIENLINVFKALAAAWFLANVVLLLSVFITINIFERLLGWQHAVWWLHLLIFFQLAHQNLFQFTLLYLLNSVVHLKVLLDYPACWTLGCWIRGCSQYIYIEYTDNIVNTYESITNTYKSGIC